VTVPGFTGADGLRAPTRRYASVAGATATPAAARVVAQRVPLGGAVLGAPLASRAALGFQCSGLACTCGGDADCNDMFSTGVCGDIASCDERGCWCLRL
jgi:hypothetical protein